MCADPTVAAAARDSGRFRDCRDRKLRASGFPIRGLAQGAYASFGLLADAASSLQSFVTVFVSIYILFIFAYVLLSWIRLPYSSVAATLQRFLDEVVSPYLRLFRGRIPTIGPLDLSPIVAVIVLLVAARVVNALIGALL
jgi:YggT family protein